MKRRLLKIGKFLLSLPGGLIKFLLKIEEKFDYKMYKNLQVKYKKLKTKHKGVIERDVKLKERIQVLQNDLNAERSRNKNLSLNIDKLENKVKTLEENIKTLKEENEKLKEV